MPYYIAEVRDSDGNDCTVFDALIAAPTRETASDRLWAHLEAAYPDDATDGGFGTFHPCECECDHSTRDNPGICDACSDGWECSHGGLLTDEPDAFREFADERSARAELARYHSLIDLTGSA